MSKKPFIKHPRKVRRQFPAHCEFKYRHAVAGRRPCDYCFKYRLERRLLRLPCLSPVFNWCATCQADTSALPPNQETTAYSYGGARELILSAASQAQKALTQCSFLYVYILYYNNKSQIVLKVLCSSQIRNNRN